MAGGFHSTSPFHHSVAFVANVTSKLPSALEYGSNVWLISMIAHSNLKNNFNCRIMIILKEHYMINRWENTNK